MARKQTPPTEKYLLDAQKDAPDFRDYIYQPALVNLKPSLRVPGNLDQRCLLVNQEPLREISDHRSDVFANIVAAQIEEQRLNGSDLVVDHDSLDLLHDHLDDGGTRLVGFAGGARCSLRIGKPDPHRLACS